MQWVVDKFVWQEVNGYRNLKCNMGDYTLFINGGGSWQFNWRIDIDKDGEKVCLISSREPCRTVPEARRILEALYIMHLTTKNALLISKN